MGSHRFEKVPKETSVAGLFEVGELVSTQGALMALLRAGQSPAEFLERHVQGDWGDLCAEDVAENRYALPWTPIAQQLHHSSGGTNLGDH